jgi:hypothetical protein
MHYYRKAAAVFILVLTLILPLFLEENEATAVVNLDRVIAASSYLSEIKVKSSVEPEVDQMSLGEAESKIMEILKAEAAELAALNSYSSILIDQAIYQGGRDITQELAKKIDEKYK